MEFIKEIKSSLMIMAGFYTTIGLIMFIAPTFVSNSICYLMGAICLIVGGLAIYTYIASEVYGSLGLGILIGAIVFISGGLFIILKPEIFASFIPLIMGVILVVDSFGKMQSSMTLKKHRYSNWWQILVFAILIFIFGIIILFNPFKTLVLLIKILGIFIIINGISSLLTAISYSKIEKAIK